MGEPGGTGEGATGRPGFELGDEAAAVVDLEPITSKEQEIALLGDRLELLRRATSPFVRRNDRLVAGHRIDTEGNIMPLEFFPKGKEPTEGFRRKSRRDLGFVAERVADTLTELEISLGK